MPKTKKIWYQEGLQFSCQCSGHCCTGTPGHVWVGASEIQLLADALSIPAKQFKKKHLRLAKGKLSLLENDDGKCEFFRDGKCQMYEARPVQCRTYPFWPEILVSKSAWKQESKECIGMNQGRHLTLKEIQKQKEETEAAEIKH